MVFGIATAIRVGLAAVPAHFALGLWSTAALFVAARFGMLDFVTEGDVP